MIREMSVAGTFYPARDVELKRYFEHFTKVYDEGFTLPRVNSRVVIVPHAGYIYSGYTANIAYRVLQQSNVKKFVVIGPSHRISFDGISVSNFESFQTPFGDIKSDTIMAQDLQKKFNLSCIAQAHAEHSTEVQFPFIKHYIKDASIVELVYSKVNATFLSQIIDYVLEDDDYGVIISTDLSHFHSQEYANRLDNICLHAIESQELELLHSGCEACGMIGVEAIILHAKKSHLHSTVLDYRTSADASNDTSRVVGYTSICFS